MSAAPPWLGEAVATLAWCWRLARRDGVTIGLTAHDRPLRIAGLGYAPAPGLTPSALRFDDDWDRDTMEVDGAITTDRVRAIDLHQGRWDGAAVDILLADWTDAAARHIVVARGSLGLVSSRGGAFAAEIQTGPAWLDDGPVAPVTSPTCRASLGDRDCRVDMARRRHAAVAVAIDGARWTLDRDIDPMAVAHGAITVLDGAATGLRAAIVAADERDLILSAELAAAGEAPIRVVVAEGCDRRLATCAGRFGNAVNFRGEAHLPGTDILTRYPGG